MTMKTVAAALALAHLAAPLAASAQQPPPVAPKLGQACRSDFLTHCAGVEKGGGARIRCLQQNAAKLGPDCAAALEALTDRREARQAACREDRSRLCRGVKASGSSVADCLRAKQSELSPACAAALAEAPALPPGRPAAGK